MAPKRSAPPPPVESSEEAASGSDSEGSSEEIAYSPPTATTKNTAPPPPKVQQPEASDGKEEDEDPEEEEEEEEELEEEGEEKANHTAPSSATQNPPQPLPQPKESDESGEDEETEEEEGTDDEAPQPVSAPKHEAQMNGGKQPQPPSSEDKKPTAHFQRTLSKEDDVRILEALAAYRREHGTLPQPEDLEAALAGCLDNTGHGRKDLADKIKSLKGMYTRNVKKVDLPSNDVDRRIFDLSREVFGGGRDRPANGTLRREFDEMCQMYPYLAEEIRALERTHPGLFKREFGLIDDDKARVLDQKIKQQRVLQMKLELHRLDMTKEVTKTMMNLLE